MRNSATSLRRVVPDRIAGTALAALFSLILAAPVTAGGNCAAELRPLLLETVPDPARVRSIRESCLAEAESGDVDAVYRLSFFYLGLDEWNPDRAVTLIRRAAIEGITEAQYWLAWQYEAGPLLPDETPSALYWYESAARGEHPLALRRLADAYDAGELGLSPDPKQASFLRAEAARCEN